MAFRKSVTLNCPIIIVTSQALQKVGTERAEKMSPDDSRKLAEMVQT